MCPPPIIPMVGHTPYLPERCIPHWRRNLVLPPVHPARGQVGLQGIYIYIYIYRDNIYITYINVEI